MSGETDMAQLAGLGQRFKGEEVRSVRLSVRVTPATLADIDAQRQDGETRADVVARLVAEVERLRALVNRLRAWERHRE